MLTNVQLAYNFLVASGKYEFLCRKGGKNWWFFPGHTYSTLDVSIIGFSQALALSLLGVNWLVIVHCHLLHSFVVVCVYIIWMPVSVCVQHDCTHVWLESWCLLVTVHSILLQSAIFSDDHDRYYVCVVCMCVWERDSSDSCNIPWQSQQNCISVMFLQSCSSDSYMLAWQRQGRVLF